MSTAKKSTKEGTFVDFLVRSNTKIKADRANRLGKSAAMAYKSLMDKKEKELFEIEDELELMVDMSADNRSTSVNRVSDFDSDAFVQKRYDLKRRKALLVIDIQLLKEDAEFYGG